MAVSRASQFIATRNLSRGSQQIRNLHIIGPKTSTAPVRTVDRAQPSSSRAVNGYRTENKRQRKEDLVAHKRPYSTVSDQTRRRSTTSIPRAPIVKQHRQFNTSRALQAIKDSSTMDFAFMPTPADTVDESDVVRVPILPTHYDNIPIQEPEEAAVMKPQVSTASADAVLLPFTDMSDGHAMNIDFHAMADRVALNLRRMKVPVEEQASLIKQVWADMVDDLLGVNKTKEAAA